MFSARDALIVSIPALPLAATLATAIFGKRWLREKSHLPALVALPLAFVLSVALLFDVRDRAADAVANGAAHGAEHVVKLWTWAAVDAAYEQPGGPGEAPTMRDFGIDISLRSDGLTSIMLSMVLFVSTLVALYAVGYMHGDPGYWRFYTYVSLFVFSMTMLVSVSNFALLYVFWEAVGACSYLLIGFWFHKPEAAAAGKKAFLVNRVGDFGFALGVFLLWTTYGTLDFHDGGAGAAGIFGAARVSGAVPYVAGGIGLAICLCLLVGACGKSAQFPLHIWLPDAMEGPTPVSALIHAATMVTAGVYLVARCTPLFAVSPDAQAVVATIGCLTALLAGLIALTQNDLKRVLAYSTVSQLGFMFLGPGTGTAAGIAAGMFHLFTHAFFKALLFLGAGSVMHAMGGIIDMRRFSGLRKVMPATHLTFWFGSLALAGVVPFAGFWSKDAILAAVHDRFGDDYLLFGDGAGGGVPLFHVLYYAALVTAFLTAFYTFRALFMTFFGETRITPEAGHHAHESPRPMTGPLWVLAACALAAGPLVMYFSFDRSFAGILSTSPSLSLPRFAAEHAAELAHEGAGHEDHKFIAGLSTVIALSGVGLAAFFYLGERRQITSIANFARSAAGLRVYYLSYGKFFIDPLYVATIVWPLRMLAALAYWADRWIIDGVVDLVGLLPRVAGAALRPLQVGLVQFYALAMVLGALVLLGIVLR